MSNCIELDRNYISKFIPKREENSNKGTFGTVLNIAGSIYYPGAAYLSSIAALKSGAGLVRLASETNVILQTSNKTPDVTFIDMGQTDEGTVPKNGLKYIKDVQHINAISIGSGLTTLRSVKEFLDKFLKFYFKSSIPIVIDADAINLISQMSKPFIPLNSVITPHPMELSRLLKIGVSEIQSDRIKYCKQASMQFDCIVVLKGKNTVISIPNGLTFVNTTGNSALSHAGTGDVLTGMIAGLAAQGMRLEDACVTGVYLHGLAGEFASLELSEFSTLASDVLNYIPKAFKAVI